MIDISRRNTVLNIFTGLFTAIVQAGIGFFLSPFIVRSLGEESNGFAQLAGNFVMYASLLTIAFNSMGGRFLTISYHNNNDDDTNRYYSSMIMCNIFIIFLLLPLSLFIISNIERIVKIETAEATDVRILFSCTFLHFFLNLFTSVYSTSLYVRNRLYFLNLLQFCSILLNAVFLLLAYSLLPAHIYYISAISLALSILLFPIIIYLKNKMLPDIHFSPNYFSFSKVVEMFKSGVWNTVNQGGHILMNGCDLLLANWFINPISMGLLAVSKTIPSFIIQLAATFNTNVSPSITISWADNNHESILKELRRNMKISSVLVATPIITFCGFSMEFYQLWMPTLDAKVLSTLSFLTCMVYIPMAGPQTLYNVFTAANKLKVNSVSYIITGALNFVIVLIILSSGFGDGIYIIAGVSSILAIIRNMVITLPYTASILNLRWYEFYKDVALSFLCCIINIVIVYAFKEIFTLTGWIELMSTAFMTGFLALLFEVVLLLSSSERKTLKLRIASTCQRMGIYSR